MIPLKRGDNFEWGGQFLGPDGAVQDFTGYGIESQVRDASGCLVEQLSASWINAAQGLYAIVSADTTVWPVGRLSFDVQITDLSGRRSSSNTEIINVIRDQTHG
ncbi:hypothetical protein [Cupriavidus taiwanensis]|uniref:hypothetical protein n=1 Tax=Cupriavidus taiwanensis TaxID=164546 RepID=UPI000E1720BA|nr:hypothetical protein [Cupriavidus taiwanensis]SPA44597.1 conserved hypothetical protein [Cupriavidus taiwanensis]